MPDTVQETGTDQNKIGPWYLLYGDGTNMGECQGHQKSEGCPWPGNQGLDPEGLGLVYKEGVIEGPC